MVDPVCCRCAEQLVGLHLAADSGFVLAETPPAPHIVALAACDWYSYA
jgi:hypothetical protein